MSIIEVDSLAKGYRVHKKKEGIKGSLSGLIKREFQYVEAVKNISFRVEEGEILGVVGQNGAGKTTTMKMLSGLLYPDSGDARILNCTPWERKREFLINIGFLMGQKGQLLWDIPAMDSFILYKEIYGLREQSFQTTIIKLSETLEVEHLLSVPVRSLSLGERMKMEIIAAVLHSPKVLFLDEPTIGLDLTTQKKLRGFLDIQNRREGTTMMLTSHYMQDITSLCSRIIIISQGEIIFDDKIEKVRQIHQTDRVVKVRFANMLDEAFLRKYQESFKEQKELQYTFQMKQEDINRFIQEVSALMPVDFSIEEQPIENIIEKIYRRDLQ